MVNERICEMDPYGNEKQIKAKIYEMMLSLK